MVLSSLTSIEGVGAKGGEGGIIKLKKDVAVAVPRDDVILGVSKMSQ